MAQSITQGGPAPCILAEEVFEYIVSGMESVTSTAWAHRIGDKAKLLIKQVVIYKDFT